MAEQKIQSAAINALTELSEAKFEKSGEDTQPYLFVSLPKDLSQEDAAHVRSIITTILRDKNFSREYKNTLSPPTKLPGENTGYGILLLFSDPSQINSPEKQEKCRRKLAKIAKSYINPGSKGQASKVLAAAVAATQDDHTSPLTQEIQNISNNYTKLEEARNFLSAFERELQAAVDTGKLPNNRGEPQPVSDQQPIEIPVAFIFPKTGTAEQYQETAKQYEELFNNTAKVTYEDEPGLIDGDKNAKFTFQARPTEEPNVWHIIMTIPPTVALESILKEFHHMKRHLPATLAAGLCDVPTEAYEKRQGLSPSGYRAKIINEMERSPKVFETAREILNGIIDQSHPVLTIPIPREENTVIECPAIDITIPPEKVPDTETELIYADAVSALRRAITNTKNISQDFEPEEFKHRNEAQSPSERPFQRVLAFPKASSNEAILTMLTANQKAIEDALETQLFRGGQSHQLSH